MDKDTLIESFVSQWGYGDAVLNEYFRRALEALIAEICPGQMKPLPIIDSERKGPIRPINLQEEE